MIVVLKNTDFVLGIEWNAEGKRTIQFLLKGKMTCLFISWQQPSWP
jgi:hypothetical protein